MKSLYEGILGDIEKRIASDDDVHEVIIDEIKQFLNDHYITHRGSKFKISKRPNKDGMYEVTCNSHVTATESRHKLKTITNGKFVFKEVKGWFDVTLCNDLISLEGCPEYVGSNFKCAHCENLKSLEGCPKHVEGNFECGSCPGLKTLEGGAIDVKGELNCFNCVNLVSLKGCPEHVGSLNISFCAKLKNLKYAPKVIDNDLICTGCENLVSLEGCPEHIPGDLDCLNCKSLSLEGFPKYIGGCFNGINCNSKIFYKKNILSICDIKGDIYSKSQFNI
jgi:hypothetical protein